MTTHHRSPRLLLLALVLLVLVLFGAAPGCLCGESEDEMRARNMEQMKQLDEEFARTTESFNAMIEKTKEIARKTRAEAEKALADAGISDAGRQEALGKIRATTAAIEAADDALSMSHRTRK